MKATKIVASTFLSWVLLAITSSSGLKAQAPASPSTLLQQGIFAEETEGDLDAAIKIYQKIVDDADNDRAFIAKAKFRLATCLVKIGAQEKGVQTFRQLLNHFGDLTELAARTRSELNRLDLPDQSASITTIIPDLGAAASGLLSPDETRVAYVDWNREKDSKVDLLIKALENSKLIPVTQTAYAPKEIYEFANFNYNNGGPGAWSPNSQQVAYLWFSGEEVQIRIAQADGSASRRVPVPESAHFSPYDWSPSEALLLGLEYSDPSREPHIAFAAIKTGTIERLTSVPGIYSHPRVSPDGQWIVAQQEIEGIPKIIAINRSTKQRLQLTRTNSKDTTPIISLDNSQVLFSSNRSGAWDLWAIALSETPSTQSPRLIQPNVGDHPKRLTQSGKISVNSSRPNHEIFAITAPTEATTKTNAPAGLSVHHIGDHSYPCWSADGSSVAARHGKSHICIQNTKTGEVEMIDPKVRMFESLFWSPNEQQFAFSTPSGTEGAGIYVFHRHNKRMTKLPPHPDARPRGGLGFSASGSEFALPLKDHQPGILWTDVATGQHRVEKFPGLPEKIEHLALSPKGTHVAFVPEGGKQLQLLNRSTQFLSTLDQIDPDDQQVFGMMQWSRNGKDLAYFGSRSVRSINLTHRKVISLLELPKRGPINWWKAAPQWHPTLPKVSFGWNKPPHLQIRLIELQSI